MHLQNVCLITVITLVLVSEINLEAHEQAGRQAGRQRVIPKILRHSQNGHSRKYSVIGDFERSQTMFRSVMLLLLA